MNSLNPGASGTTVLVEQCSRIDINKAISLISPQIKEQLLKSYVNFQGYDVGLESTVTAFGGERYWFKCPLCNKRSGVLYLHPVSNLVGCRSCLNIEHKSRRYKNMLESRV